MCVVLLMLHTFSRISLFTGSVASCLLAIVSYLRLYSLQEWTDRSKDSLPESCHEGARQCSAALRVATQDTATVRPPEHACIALAIPTSPGED